MNIFIIINKSSVIILTYLLRTIRLIFPLSDIVSAHIPRMILYFPGILPSLCMYFLAESARSFDRNAEIISISRQPTDTVISVLHCCLLSTISDNQRGLSDVDCIKKNIVVIIDTDAIRGMRCLLRNIPTFSRFVRALKPASEFR